MAGAAMLSSWRLREQMLDCAMRADGGGNVVARGGAVDDATRGGGRATRSVVVATEDDKDGWDLPPLPARQRRMA
jgi:hypothetical protein